MSYCSGTYWHQLVVLCKYNINMTVHSRHSSRTGRLCSILEKIYIFVKRIESHVLMKRKLYSRKIFSHELIKTWAQWQNWDKKYKLQPVCYAFWTPASSGALPQLMRMYHKRTSGDWESALRVREWSLGEKRRILSSSPTSHSLWMGWCSASRFKASFSTGAPAVTWLK